MKKIFFFCAFCLTASNFFANGQVKITFLAGKIHRTKRSGQHLFLAGDFNNWNPADTAWELIQNQTGTGLKKLLPKGIYNFKITCGSWASVECTSDGKSVANRSLALTIDTTITIDVANWQDNFAVVEKKHTVSKNVHLISEKFDMPQLGRQRRIWIYLPEGSQTSGKKYPVIYMHDGQNLFDEYTSGYGEWGVDEFMDKLTRKQQYIIVGIDHGGDYRISEYDPFDSKYGKGRGVDYVEFLINTLKPYIDAHYPTKTGAKNTTIAGSSMGGLISMYAALKYPDVFGNAGIFSPAFWIAAPQVYEFAQQQQLKNRSRFYFVCGDLESGTMVTDMQKMAGIIRQKGISEANTPVIIVKGATHNEKQWNGDFPGFYEWLAPPGLPKGEELK